MKDFQEILESINSFNICIRCTGRLFALVGHGLDNLERGNSIIFAAEAMGTPIHTVSEDVCSLCGGIFNEIQSYGSEIKRLTEPYEFGSLLVGSSFNSAILEREEGYQKLCGSHGESIKKEFSRLLGKDVTERMNKEFDRENPDIMIKVNTEFMSIALQIKSLYIYGSYRKYIRGIPQTRWIKYSEETRTVESLIGVPVMELSRGENYALHGAGREDVDVKMLGNGREFVLEIINPKIRSVDLEKLTSIINDQKQGVEVSDLRFSNKKEVVRIKSEKNSKVYLAKLNLSGKDNYDRVSEKASELIGKVIYQRTPLRVSISRSDLVRERKVIGITARMEPDGSIVLTIEAEAGTYIKELISGDEGRTTPSLAELLMEKVRIEELDVIEIKR